MDILLIAFAIGLTLLVIIAFTRRGQPGSDVPVAAPYAARALFSPAERSFLGVLDQASGGTYRVFGKVRLFDLLKVDSGLTARDRAIAINKVTAKHVDFVICAPDDLRVLAVVELDDASHAAKGRRERDAFVDRALTAAGIRVHHFAAKATYSVHDVRRELGWLEGSAGHELGTEAPESIHAPPHVTASAPPPDSVMDATERPPAPRDCPTCGSPMIERTARRGARAGQTFLACRAYPACRTTVAL
jgi:hypothetical protein